TDVILRRPMDHRELRLAMLWIREVEWLAEKQGLRHRLELLPDGYGVRVRGPSAEGATHSSSRLDFSRVTGSLLWMVIGRSSDVDVEIGDTDVLGVQPGEAPTSRQQPSRDVLIAALYAIRQRAMDLSLSVVRQQPELLSDDDLLTSICQLESLLVRVVRTG